MATLYKYLAMDRGRRLVRGVVEAEDDRLAEEQLSRDGLRAISLQRSVMLPWLRTLTPTPSNAVSQKDVVHFSQQLATLLSSGVPVVSAVQLLRDQSASPGLQAVLADIDRSLKEGQSLAEAMRKAPRVFSPVYVRLIEAGERSGTLETVLRHLAIHLQKQVALKAQIKKALTYPAIVVVVGIVVLAVIVTFVLPSISELLSSFNADLPLLTRIVIGLSDAVQAGKFYAVLALLGLGSLAVWWSRTPEGRLALDRFMLKAPGLGRLTLQRNVAQFSRTASLLLGAGLPISDALVLARDATPNRVFQNAVEGAREKVIQGASLAEALQGMQLLPGLFVQMVRVGEETGALESNLSSMADFYEREVEERLNVMVGLIEPAMTVVLGVGVAIVALAVLLPMFDLLDAVDKAR